MLPRRDWENFDCDFLCSSVPTVTVPFMKVWWGSQMYVKRPGLLKVFSKVEPAGSTSGPEFHRSACPASLFVVWPSSTKLQVTFSPTPTLTLFASNSKLMTLTVASAPSAGAARASGLITASGIRRRVGRMARQHKRAKAPIDSALGSWRE